MRETETARLDVRRLGEGGGEPLLMICATAQPWVIWEPLAQAFAAHVPVIGYDQRGLGASEVGAGPISAATLAADALSVLDAQDVARAHLLGWSLGSAVCQELAISHPERVASIVLWGTWAATDAYQYALMSALRHPWATGDLATALTVMALVFSRESVNVPGFAARMAAARPAFPQTAEGMQAVVDQWDVDLAHDVRDRLAQITAPALVVAGEHDMVTPAPHGRAVADAIPGAQFETLSGPGSSHALGLERASEFVPLVLAFLGRCATLPLTRD